MDIDYIIRKRHSVRSYEDRQIEKELVKKINAKIKEINAKSGLKISLILNEEKAFDIYTPHYGKLDNVKNYIALTGPSSDQLDELCGYYGEELVLYIESLGLNTCYTAVTYDKTKVPLKLNTNEELCLVIALGYGKTAGKPHKSKGYHDVVINKEDTPAWFKKGIEYALLAPTALNQQKFTFELLDNNRVRATAQEGICSMVDLGIVKYHFVLGAGKDNFKFAE